MPVCTAPTRTTPMGGWVLQQQGPAEPAFILSQDNRFLACFEEALDAERNVMLAAPELLRACEAFLNMSYPMASQRMSDRAAQDIQKHRQFVQAAIALAKGGA